MLLSPVLRNQRQVNLFEFEAILVHTVISRTAMLDKDSELH